MIERQKTALYHTAGEILLHATRIEVLHPERLTALKEVLKTKSVIWYTNHYARLEPFTQLKTVAENVATLDKTMGTVDKKHLDSDGSSISQLQAALIHGWENAFGAHAVAIAKEEDADCLTGLRAFNKKSLDTIRDFLSVPGNIVLISPEGTRSPSRELLEAKRGLELIFKRSRDTTVAIPVASEYHSVIPFGPPTIIVPGEYFTYDEIKAQQEDHPDLTLTDLMMVKLANLLDPQSWGHYKQVFETHPELIHADEFAGVKKFY